VHTPSPFQDFRFDTRAVSQSFSHSFYLKLRGFVFWATAPWCSRPLRQRRRLGRFSLWCSRFWRLHKGKRSGRGRISFRCARFGFWWLVPLFISRPTGRGSSFRKWVNPLARRFGTAFGQILFDIRARSSVLGSSEILEVGLSSNRVFFLDFWR